MANLQIGDSKPKSIYYGNNKIKEAWLGSTKLWSSNVPTFVAVGYSGFIAYSSDAGITWNNTTSGVSDDLNFIVASPDLFVVSGYNTSYILRSTDGITWTKVDTPFSNVDSMTFAQSKFVVVNGSSTLYYSTDAITWSSVTTSMYNMYSIEYVNDRFFATDGSQAWYSIDLSTWNYFSVPTIYPNVFGGGGGTYLIASSSTTNQIIATSNNGVNWTSSNVLYGRRVYDIEYGNGYSIMTTINDTDYHMVAKYSAATWSYSMPDLVRKRRLAYSSTYGIFGTVASLNYNFLYSTDGITWTTVTNAFTKNPTSIAFKE
ncbi:WD40/YVTN/BNR-like repeat-containing protein [Anaerosporobacter sp.]